MFVVAHLTVGLDESEITRCGAAGPHHKLADAPVGLIFAAWALRREALIVVIVADENDIRTIVIERLVQIDGGAALVAARTEGRPVVVGQRTGSPISVQVSQRAAIVPVPNRPGSETRCSRQRCATPRGRMSSIPCNHASTTRLQGRGRVAKVSEIALRTLGAVLVVAGHGARRSLWRPHVGS